MDFMDFLGTPVELSPTHDDPSIAKDDKRINNFTFNQSAGQSKCPYASHIRKSNPRNDVTPVESAFKHLCVYYFTQMMFAITAVSTIAFEGTICRTGPKSPLKSVMETLRSMSEACMLSATKVALSKVSSSFSRVN